jgi:L,D-transpeptidase catalytic domain/TAT (twin-arginine translocation) pathway signal sequence
VAGVHQNCYLAMAAEIRTGCTVWPTMKLSRRQFLRAATGTAAVLALPITPSTALACAPDDGTDADEICGPSATVLRAPGDPPFEAFWVATYLGTRLWPTASSVQGDFGLVGPGRLFRVDAPQRGYRLLVWDPRANQHVYIGSEAVGPAETPFWSAFADDGKWMDVTLTPPQNIKAMQGDALKMRDLVTAGLQGTTKPGFYRILRRVYNETMDSRTIPNLRDTYLLKDVMFTQYFAGDGAAIHYNWWGPPRGFGNPGSHGRLGMRWDGAKFLWDWANIGTPIVIHH